MYTVHIFHNILSLAMEWSSLYLAIDLRSYGLKEVGRFVDIVEHRLM
jgi:hypothetical protein